MFYFFPKIDNFIKCENNNQKNYHNKNVRVKIYNDKKNEEKTINKCVFFVQVLNEK